MPTQLVSIGPPTTLVQNQVYALPAQLVNITTSAACEVSVNQTTWTAYTSGTNTSASFIRSALVNTIITTKSATKGSGGGSVPSDAITLTDYIALGSTPAQSGAIRLSNNTIIKSRNSANTQDIDILQVGIDNSMNIGFINPPAYFNLGNTNCFFNGPISARNVITFSEISAPTAPGTNDAKLFLQDNGSGKTQLMILFNTGVAIQLAIQV